MALKNLNDLFNHTKNFFILTIILLLIGTA